MKPLLGSKRHNELAYSNSMLFSLSKELKSMQSWNYDGFIIPKLELSDTNFSFKNWQFSYLDNNLSHILSKQLGNIGSIDFAFKRDDFSSFIDTSDLRAYSAEQSIISYGDLFYWQIDREIRHLTYEYKKTKEVSHLLLIQYLISIKKYLLSRSFRYYSVKINAIIKVLISQSGTDFRLFFRKIIRFLFKNMDDNSGKLYKLGSNSMSHHTQPICITINQKINAKIFKSKAGIYRCY